MFFRFYISVLIEGIKIATDKDNRQIVSRTCGRCNYVNKLESKYCERVGCNYPLTQLALDEIKAGEQAKFQELVDKSNLERDNTIQVLQQELKSAVELCKHSMELSIKQKSMIDDVMSENVKLMGEYNDLKSLLDKSMAEYNNLAKTAFGRIDELQSVMRGGLLIKPGREAAEEIQRRVKILLQVAPDWQKRTASGNARLTPEEERKFMELINQPKAS